MFNISIGVQNWEVVQNINGTGKIRFCGECELKDVYCGLAIRAFDECTDEPVTEWTEINIKDRKWETTLNLPLGGPYRIEFRFMRADVWKARWSLAHMLHHICVGDVFVIAGQSNSIGMGHGELTETPELGIHTMRDCKYWDIATNPMYSSRGHNGPFLAFAKRLKRTLQYPIGLIPCAVGGSSLSEWLKNEDGHLYNEMISVINGKKIKGVLWYQGESEGMDCKSENYFERFERFVNDMREDLNNKSLHVLTVQLHRHTDDFENGEEMDFHYDNVREAQRQAARKIKNVYVIPSIDVGRLSDGIHNSKSANIFIGERLARQALFSVYGKGLDPSAPDVERIKKISDKEIEVVFSGVEDTLMAYHVKNPNRLPLMAEDDNGINAIESFELLKDSIKLKLSRTVEENTYIKCQYGRNPYGIIQDFGKQTAVLCFSNVKVAMKE